MQQIEEENPLLFDDLQNRKKWTHVGKNTTRALKNSNMNNAYWNLLNHAPLSQVKQVVTPRVLEMDRRSCDKLLKSILEEKQEENNKKAKVQKERRASLNRLAHAHNERLALANRLGVKIKGRPIMPSPEVKIRENFNTAQDRLITIEPKPNQVLDAIKTAESGLKDNMQQSPVVPLIDTSLFSEERPEQTDSILGTSKTLNTNRMKKTSFVESIEKIEKFSKVPPIKMKHSFRGEKKYSPSQRI